MSQLKHFTILELDADSENPMVGTIDNVTSDLVGKEHFYKRLVKALEEHFDAEVNVWKATVSEALDCIFGGSPYEDVEISVADFGFEDKSFSKMNIRIIETWIY